LSEEDTEEVILTRWERLKNWWDIIKTGLTLGKLLWGFLFVSAGAVVVGEATDTSPVRDAAELAGIVQPDTNRAELLTRIDSLDETVEQLNAALERIQARNYPDPVDGQTGPAGRAGKDGKDGKDGRDGRDGVDAQAVVQVDDALERHKVDDH